MKGRVAVIPARGGSKRLPRKNILSFLGKPIIGWSIEAAKNSGLFEQIFVSTDDDEIVAISEQFGADIDYRDPNLATDEASVANVCLDFLRKEGSKGKAWREMVVLYATAPMRTAEDIRQTVALLKNEDCKFALAATDYDLPPHQALKLGDNQQVQAMWPEIVAMKASDVGRLVVDNGSTYAVNVDAFLGQKNFYGPGLRVHLMPRHRSHDIDEAIDFKIVEFFAQQNELA